MKLRNQQEYKGFYGWLVAICNSDIVERLDGTLGDFEADRILASFLDDIDSDGHIEVSKSFTISKNPEINSFDTLSDWGVQ